MAFGPVLDSLPRDARLNGHGPFLRYLAPVRDEINERIEQQLKRRQCSLGDILRYHFLQGKRLRGGMTVLLHDALGGCNRDAALDLAAAVELSHAISLIIDDIIDGDQERRGQPAIHVRLGSKRAILEVVGSLALPYSMVSAYGPALVDRLARTHERMVRSGMIEQSEAAPSAIEAYEFTISMKTGDLFALAAHFGAHAAAAPPRQVELADRYGRMSGMALQVADDIVDMSAVAGPPGRSEEQLRRWLEGGRAKTADECERSLLERCIYRAQDSARDLLAEVQAYDAKWPPCLLGAPAEMAELMLR